MNVPVRRGARLSEESPQPVTDGWRPRARVAWGFHMKPDQMEATENPEETTGNKVRVLLATIGTLMAVFGIAICVFGLVEFNSTKVITGVCVIVVSTITYILMLTGAG
jgi:hypothetical protein